MNSRSLICASVLSGLLATGTAAAQPLASPTDIGQARLRWADRHQAVVCAPLRARGDVFRALKCLERVAAVRRDAGLTGEATASLPAAGASADEWSGPVPPARPRSAGCAGVECIKLFGSLGVAF